MAMRFCRGDSGFAGVGSLSTYDLDGFDLRMGDSSRDLGVLIDFFLKVSCPCRSDCCQGLGTGQQSLAEHSL